MNSLNYNEAGLKLSSIALKLYRSRRYRHEQSLIAERFLDAALDAGRLVSELQACPREHLGFTAARALEGVDKLVYLAFFMRDEGFYTEREIDPVVSAAKTLRPVILNIIKEEEKKRKEAKRPAPVTPVYITAPAPARAPAPAPSNAAPRPAVKPAAKPAVKRHIDPDGFDDPI